MGVSSTKGNYLSFVMAGLDPAIHVFSSLTRSKTWITGTSPVMTAVRAFTPR
jgi:hypothetical protein